MQWEERCNGRGERKTIVPIDDRGGVGDRGDSDGMGIQLYAVECAEDLYSTFKRGFAAKVVLPEQLEGGVGHGGDSGSQGRLGQRSEVRRVQGGHGDSALLMVGELLRIVGSEPEDHGGNLCLRAEDAKIFAAHDGLDLNDMLS